MSDVIPNLTALVRELREKTGVGIMACKKALVESNGDIEQAYDLLRTKGEKMAESKASRSATEGKIAMVKGQHDIAMVTVQCETDFVSQGEDFQSYADAIAKIAYDHKIDTIDALLGQSYGEGTVETARVALVSKVGENVQISRVEYMNLENGFVSTYSHGEKLCCAVFLSDDNEVVARDVGMHVVAMNPVAILAEDVPETLVERERKIFAAETEKIGKPELAKKIIDGKMAKFFKEVCLLGQDFVKDPSISVGDYVKKSGTSVLQFIRVEVS